MSLLLNALPETVEICGQSVPIKTDFRSYIQFEQILIDSSATPQEKVKKALALAFDDIRAIPLNDPQQIIDGLLWFYRGGDKPQNEYQIKEKKKAEAKQKESDQASNSGERYYDYEFDAELIYAAFLQQYGVDLIATEYMHWWRFKALFSGLTDDTKFMQVVGYRATKVTKDMTDSQRKFYRQMKEIYALPIPQDEVEKAEAIEAALQSGDVVTLMRLIGDGGER